jgi:hypothetical protein
MRRKPPNRRDFSELNAPMNPYSEIEIPVSTASGDAIAALRLLIVYYTTFEEGAAAQIMKIADDLFKQADFENKRQIRLGERREGGGVAHYHRANADAKLLSSNYELMRKALEIWLQQRKSASVPPDFVESLHQRVFGGRRSSDFYFDEFFIRSSFTLDTHNPDVVMQRVVDEQAGFWLLYRISTLQPDDQTGRHFVNVSLLRITPFAHLKNEGANCPKFIYEFRSESGPNRGRPDRAEGYLYRTGGHINAIGRRLSSDNRAVVTFSWRTPEVVLNENEPVHHHEEIRSLGYGTDSEGTRIGFLFIAKFVPGTHDIAEEHYAKVRSAYQSLISRYAPSELATRFNDFSRSEDIPSLNGIPPYISESEYEDLLKQSVESAVLKQQR